MEEKYLSWELKLNLSTLLDLRGSVGYFHGGQVLSQKSDRVKLR